MKKIITICLTLVLFSGLATSGDLMVEVKGQYFSPTEQAFKDIYGGGMMFGGEVRVSVWKGLSLWIGADYFAKKGKLSFTGEETKLQIIPLGLGLLYSHPLFKTFSIYGGGGVQYYSYSEKNPIGNVNESGFGFLGEAGSIVKPFGGLFFDIFIRYSTCKIESSDFKNNIGGLSVGVGLGILF